MSTGSEYLAPAHTVVQFRKIGLASQLKTAGYDAPAHCEDLALQLQPDALNASSPPNPSASARGNCISSQPIMPRFLCLRRAKACSTPLRSLSLACHEISGILAARAPFAKRAEVSMCATCC